MCSCLSGSSWNLQLLRNGSKTSFQLVLITIALRAALCSLDIHQLVNGLMLFYSEKKYTTGLIHTTTFSVLFLRSIRKHSYSEGCIGEQLGYLAQGYTARRLQQTGVEPPAYRLVGDLLYYPNYCHPQ